MKKKITTFLALTAVALATLTSCDKDRETARTLDGTWTGYIDVYYADRWGWTNDGYRTSICFYREDAYGGYGYEADYSLDYGDRAYSEFDWEVRNGSIYIDYADRRWNPVRIYEYKLYDDYFEGYMDDGTRQDIHFRLTYDGNYNWNNWHTTYYAPRRADGTADRNVHIGGPRGTNYFATGRFAERLDSLDAQAAGE